MTFLDAIPNTIQTAWNAVTTFFSTLWNSISTAATTAWNAITTLIDGIPAKIGTGVEHDQ